MTNTSSEIQRDSAGTSIPSALERRLDDGYRRIEEARLRGVDVRAWEDFWLQLSREYEDVCDGLRLAAAA